MVKLKTIRMWQEHFNADKIWDMKVLSFAVILNLILHANFAAAKEKKVDPQDPLATTLGYNSNFANWVDQQAKKLDLALSGARYSSENGDSEARFSQRVNWAEKDGLTFETDFDLQLALPNLEKKYKLMLSSYNENQTRRSAYSRFRNAEREDANYGADLSFLSRIGDFDVTFRPRIQFGSPFKTFYSLVFDSEYKRKNLSFRTRFNFFADSDKGTGQFVSFTLERSFWTYWRDSLVFEQEYQDGGNVLSLLQGYSLDLVLNSKMSLSHSLVVSSDSEDSNFRLKNVSLGPLFYHNIYPRFFNYTVIFTESYDIDHKFRGDSVLSVIFEVVF